MTHPRAQAFLDAYDLDVTTVDTEPVEEFGQHRVVVVNFTDKSWVFDFGHHKDHDFCDVSLFDDTQGVEIWHENTAGAHDNPDGPSTPVGMFSIMKGQRVAFEDTGVTNHGWPAVPTVTLLADHPKAA